MAILIGVLGGLAIGISLGLIGGGGATLALPLLLLLGAEAKPAIALSLLVVAVTAAAAAAGHAGARRVSWRSALLFGPTTMLGGYLGGRAAGSVSGDLLLLGFALLMSGSAFAMWRPSRGASATELPMTPLRGSGVALVGAAVGAVTGLVGAGGGFLFVPTFALLLRLPMSRAVGTSLVVIALNAAAALVGHLGHVALDLRLGLPVTAGALAGAVLGTRISAAASERALRRGFALFLLAIAAWLLARNPLLRG